MTKPPRFRVYVAGPYTTPDPVLNTRRAVLAGQRILQVGAAPFVPHLTHLWHTIAPEPYETWLDLDNEWLRACDMVLRLPGASSGADKEVELALELGIHVVEGDVEQFVADLPGFAKLCGCNLRPFDGQG